MIGKRSITLKGFGSGVCGPADCVPRRSGMSRKLSALAMTTLLALTIPALDGANGAEGLEVEAQPRAREAVRGNEGPVGIQIGGQYRLMGNSSNFYWHAASISASEDNQSFFNQRFRTWLTVSPNDRVSGYLETETLGDTGVAGTFELRSPNLPTWLATVLKDVAGQPVKASAINEFRFFAFTDAGVVITLDPLPGQQSTFYLASYGVGAKVKMLDHVNGMVAFAMPVISETYTTANKPRVLFRVSGEF